MPELPEVETIRRQLREVLVGQVITNVEVRREKSFPQFVEVFQGRKGIVGEKIIAIGRKAKILIIDLENDLHLLIHLKMTGQLIYQKSEGRNQKADLEKVWFTDDKPHLTFDGRIVGGHPTDDWIKSLPTKHTRVILQLTKGTLFFNDMRVFGWMKIVESSKFKAQMSKLPPDVTDKGFTLGYFKGLLAKSKKAVKLVLMDQTRIGGVGNIYANEALWKARIDPRRRASTLNDRELKELYTAVKLVIEQGIKWGGASESTYKHINGLGGKYQEHFLVYKRQGERCQRKGCGGVVTKITLGGRGTYFCPHCQH